MSNEIKYNDMSNSELRIKLKEMENEYEKIKNEISLKFKRMDELDEKYNMIIEIFNKRSKGIIV